MRLEVRGPDPNQQLAQAVHVDRFAVGVSDASFGLHGTELEHVRAAADARAIGSDRLLSFGLTPRCECCGEKQQQRDG